MYIIVDFDTDEVSEIERTRKKLAEDGLQGSRLDDVLRKIVNAVSSFSAIETDLYDTENTGEIRIRFRNHGMVRLAQEEDVVYVPEEHLVKLSSALLFSKNSYRE